VVLSHINLNVTTVRSCVNKYRSRLVVKLTGDVFDCVYFLSKQVYLVFVKVSFSDKVGYLRRQNFTVYA